MNTFYASVISQYKTTDSALATHTRMPDTSNGVYGGKFAIPVADYADVFKKYAAFVFRNNNAEYIVEVQNKEKLQPILIDLDFRYEPTVKTRQHTREQLAKLRDAYVEVLSELIAIKGTFEVYIMERADPVCLADKTKDGVHIFIGIDSKCYIQQELRSRMLLRMPDIFAGLPITNSWDDVLDKAITDRVAPWMCIGSQKPNHLPYGVTDSWTITSNGSDRVPEIMPLTFIPKRHYAKLLLHGAERPHFPETFIQNPEVLVASSKKLKLKLKLKSADPVAQVPLTPGTGVSFPNTELGQWIRLGMENNLFPKLVYPEWINVGIIIKNDMGASGEDIFTELTRPHPTFDEADVRKIYGKLGTTILQSGKKSIGIGSLVKYLQGVNPDVCLKITAEVKRIINNENIIETDQDAVEVLHKLYGSRIVRTMQGWAVRPIGKNFWKFENNEVHQLITLCNIRKQSDKKTIGYGCNHSGGTNIFGQLQKSTILFPQNVTFINEINRKTRGRVYFRNKYYSLPEQKFITIGDDDIVPLCFIDRDAPDADVCCVKAEEFLANMFDDKLTIDTVLRSLSRAFGGFIADKVFHIWKGVRNSGKGMLQTLIQNAFDDYCAIGDVPTFRPGNNSDAGQEARWIITTGATYRRALFCNEAKVKSGGKAAVLDGAIIKKCISSGGDLVNSRLHGGNETKVVNNCTAFMSMNESPISDPADAMQTSRTIMFPYKFVPKAEVGLHNTYREADSALKDQIQDDAELRDGFLMLVLRAFTDTPVAVSEMPLDSQDDYAEMMAKCNTEPAGLLRAFFEDDGTAWTPMEIIIDVFSPAQKTPEFLGKFLTKSGYKKAQKKYQDRRAWGYSGLKLKVILGEDEEADNGCRL